MPLYIELMKLYCERENTRQKKVWVNGLMQEIRDGLQFRSSAPKVADVDLYRVALNRKKIEAFKRVVFLARKPRVVLSKPKRTFEIVAQVRPFKGAGELIRVSRSKVAFSNAFGRYDDPYEFLQQLKQMESPVVAADYQNYFVKIEYRVLNKEGFDASGGERSEFFLLNALEDAKQHDMLLIDEPESSFDNNFLKKDVNELIKEISAQMPVVLVTHNNTVGASIRPDYVLCAKRELEGSEVVWRTYAGYPTSKKLVSPDGKSINTWDATMGCLEAGATAYVERSKIYENIKN